MRALVLGSAGFIGTHLCAALRAEGHEVAHLHLRLLEPFPVEQVRPLVARARRVLVVENNLTGQLRQLLQLKVGMHERFESCLKYDGNPFTVTEIVERARQVLGVPARTSEVS